MSAQTNTDTTYQGWTNYETWAAVLWLDNDEPAYRHRTRDAARLTACLPAGEVAATLSALMREWAEQAAPDLGPTLWANLLRAALDDVNWVEVAPATWTGSSQ